MSKFSVKKPLTVLVAVIVVLVLGVVSYTRMTPDLLPNINLPYVIVVTPYPGATPEAAEREISKPLEQAMATLENIVTVSSSSAANYSMVTMEFTETANMDSITVDVLQKINTVEGNWSEMVGTPIILKLNPNMLPVMVAAVDKEGLDTIELSTFVKENVLTALEGTSGVASLTVEGLLEESVAVTIDADKIAALNDTLRGKVDKELNDAKEELDNAQAEIDSGKAEIESGKQELENGKDELNQQTADAEHQINEKQQEINAARVEIKTQLITLKDQLAALEETEGQLSAIVNGVLEWEKTIETLQAEIALMQELQATWPELKAQKDTFDGMIAVIEANTSLTPEQKAQAIAELKADPAYVQAMADHAEAEALLAARGQTAETLPLYIVSLQTQLAAAQSGLAALDQVLAELGMDRETLVSSMEELTAGKAQLTDAIAMLEATLLDLDAGEVQLSEALKTLQLQKTAAILEMSTATAQLLNGELQLQSAQAQIDEGLKAFEEGRKTAYAQSDMEAVLTKETVAQLLMAQNFSMPAGYVEEDGISTLVGVGDTIGSIEELRDTVLLDLRMEGVAPIRLSDVATVELVDNSDDVFARVNGRDGIILSFSKQSTYATAEVSKNLLSRFEELSAEYPGLHFSQLMDQGDFIYLMVDTIVQNLLVSALFSVLILFLFLKDIKPTFITLCSIPLSVLFALVLMYFSGVTLNLISMSALAVSIGMLVDNSVVVIENIYRLRYKGVDPIRAAVSGASQVAGAIAASTLTTICVFLPIVFVEGLTRQLFSDMALTLGYALMASLIVALTLVPSMSVRLLRNNKERTHKWFDKFIAVYRRILAACLNRKVWVILASVGLLVMSVGLALMRGFTFMPQMSSVQMTVTVTGSKEHTVDDLKADTNEAMARILEIEGIETVGAVISAGNSTSGSSMLSGSLLSGGAGASLQSTMYVILEESYLKQSYDIAAQINEMCADLSCEVEASGSSMDSMMVLFGGSGLTINLYGEETEALQQAAVEVADIVGSLKSVASVDNGMGETDPELHFSVDKAKAAAKGLTVAQVYQEIAKALTTDVTATTLTENGKTYDVIVSSGSVPSPSELSDYTFTVKNAKGEEEEVALKDVATVKQLQSPKTITRMDQRRYMTITAELNEGYNVTLVTSDVQKLLESYEAPEGVTIEFAGENEAIMDAMSQMMVMLLLGVLFVYLVMVAQFQSLKSPFIVMFTIPLAFTGGFLGLLICGFEVSVISIIGFVMLTGIIVNNGIVLVDYVNQLRADGMSKREALIEAGATRMRPILMTSITTILGLFMSALATGTGSEMMQPIAVVCIGGMIYATIMTLFVVPVMYDLFNRKEAFKVITDEQLTEVDE
ncbi:MAG: efflux RND transporter permease subunit [Clostridia bacterium]|nr:efflux RND transporter permease subunit [Clostridia bacterium]